MAVAEPTIEDIGHNLENAKIDTHTKSFVNPEIAVERDSCINQEHPMHLSPDAESFPSNGSASSSDAYGDVANIYCSVSEYSEMAFIPAPEAFTPSPGPVYGDVFALNTDGYVSYAVDGIHYQSPVINYNYLNQQVYSPLTSEMQNSKEVGGGYSYAPQVYHYPFQPYYQPAPIGHYVPPSSGLPEGSMMMAEAQDPQMIPNAYISFSSDQGMISSYPVAIVQQQQQPLVEAEAVSGPLIYPRATAAGGVMMIDAQDSSIFENIYTSGNPYQRMVPLYPLAVQQQPLFEAEMVPAPAYSSQTLGPTAPSWIEPSKQKVLYKDGAPARTSSMVQLNSAVSFPPWKKYSANGHASKSNRPILGFNAAVKGSCQSNPLISKSANAKVGDTEKAVHTPNVQPVALAEPPGDMKDCWASKVKDHTLPLANTSKALNARISKDPAPNLDVINSLDFTTKFDDAKFFIIKSYSEENVYKSIQHNVWASTPNGNKKLDDAFEDAQQRSAEKHRGCPVFLFFSVNGSLQFCGVAEMMSPVDYNRTMEFWEQHKWNGSFQVKWRIVKDVPNSQFCKIILQNNENKPVTYSRDTQEVGLQQGLEMFNIFKSYPARGSILDEFPALEAALQDVKPQWSLQNFPKTGESVSRRQSSDSGLNITTILNFAPAKECNGASKGDEVALE